MELSVGELAQVLGQSQPRVSRACEDPVRRRDRRAAQGRAAGCSSRLGAHGMSHAALRRARRWEGDARITGPRPTRRGWRRCAPIGRAPRPDGSKPMPANGTRSGRSTSPRAKSRRRWPGALGDDAARRPDRYRHRHRADARIVRAARAEHALGIDRSSEMLRLARAKLPSAGWPMPSCARPISMRCRSQDGGADARDPAPCAPFRAAARARRSPKRRAC